MEVHLRKQYLPVELKDGVLSCKTRYEVCRVGQRLSPQQANLLELFGKKTATFEIHVLCLVCDDKFEQLEECPEADMEIEVPDEN